MSDLQEGIEYERRTYNALKRFGITSGSLVKAHKDGLDLKIKRGNKTAGLELKLKPTSAGSIVMQYYDGGWHFGDTEGSEEKAFLQSIGEEARIIQLMNRKWKAPVLQYKDGKKIFVGAKKEKAYEADMRKFSTGLGVGDLYKEVPSGIISDYYNAKNSFYLNIGNRGFYLLNNKDPLDMNYDLGKQKMILAPDFSQVSGRTVLRVRCQPKIKRPFMVYQFSFTVEMTALDASPYNLSPIKSGTRSMVDLADMQNNPLIQLF